MKLFQFTKVIFLGIFFLLLCEITFAQDRQKLILALDWFANPNHAPLFVAEQQGIFSRYGLDVTIVVPGDPSDPVKWLVMNKVDIALDYQPHFLITKTRHLPIMQIGTLIDKPLNSLVVLEKSHIKTIQDLKGKKIGYSSPEIDLLILKAMLKKKGILLSEVTAINVHYNLVQALLSGQIDAAMGMMRNIEIPQLENLHNPSTVFFPEEYGIPSYSELIFVAKTKSSIDPRIKLFFQALNEAKTYLAQHPQEMWEAFAKNHPEQNSTINKKIWFNSIPLFAEDFSFCNTVQSQKWLKLVCAGQK